MKLPRSKSPRLTDEGGGPVSSSSPLLQMMLSGSPSPHISSPSTPSQSTSNSNSSLQRQREDDLMDPFDRPEGDALPFSTFFRKPGNALDRILLQNLEKNRQKNHLRHQTYPQHDNNDVKAAPAVLDGLCGGSMYGGIQYGGPSKTIVAQCDSPVDYSHMVIEDRYTKNDGDTNNDMNEGNNGCAAAVDHHKMQFDVLVKIEKVDWPTLSLEGFLTIFNLTQDYCRLTTYFTGQIIDNRLHSFETKAWRATADSDLMHWSRFAPFAPYIPALKDQLKLDSDNLGVVEQGRASLWRFPFARHHLSPTPNTAIFPLNEHVNNINGQRAATSLLPLDPLNDTHVYMRWKELFLTDPHPQPTTLCGASYDGFYYVCWCRANKSIDAFYYHDSQDTQFQHLRLGWIGSERFNGRMSLGDRRTESYLNELGSNNGDGEAVKTYVEQRLKNGGGMRGVGESGYGSCIQYYR